MTGKIRILHILWSGYSGGAERLVKDIHTFYDRTKFDHQVCFLSDGGWLSRTIAEKGVTVSCLGMKDGFSFIKGFYLNKVLKTYNPDIIHSHCRNFLSNFIISRYRRVAKIYFEHGGDLLSTKSKRDLIFYDFFIRFYKLVLVNSEYVKQRILDTNRIDARRVRTFYIGIDPRPYEKSRDQKDIRQSLGIKEYCKVIGVVCRLIDQKGVDDFIKTASEIKKMRKDIVFLVVGEGGKREALEKMAVDIGVNIRFLGDRADVPDLLSIFDIFLFTSKWEPFGIALLEAMAAQVPILGFAVGGAREIIDKGGGILLEDRDHEKLAELVVNVLRDRTVYKRLATQGYSNLTNNFHIEKSIRRLEQEYLMLTS